MFLQEEPITNRRWERSDSDWMILPATAGSYSSFMVLILFIKGRDTGSAVIFLGLIGASLAMYLFNKYPAKVFVPDGSTLESSVSIATAAIIGNSHLRRDRAILPMFLGCYASHYYASWQKERHWGWMHPIIDKKSRIHLDGPQWGPLTILYRRFNAKMLYMKVSIRGCPAICALILRPRDRLGR